MGVYLCNFPNIPTKYCCMPPSCPPKEFRLDTWTFPEEVATPYINCPACPHPAKLFLPSDSDLLLCSFLPLPNLELEPAPASTSTCPSRHDHGSYQQPAELFRVAPFVFLPLPFHLAWTGLTTITRHQHTTGKLLAPSRATPQETCFLFLCSCVSCHGKLGLCVSRMLRCSQQALLQESSGLRAFAGI